MLSGVNAPSLNNAPIGFAGLDRSIEPGETLAFRQTERPGELFGHVVKLPFVQGTSRRDMADFLG